MAADILVMSLQALFLREETGVPKQKYKMLQVEQSHRESNSMTKIVNDINGHWCMRTDVNLTNNMKTSSGVKQTHKN